MRADWMDSTVFFPMIVREGWSSTCGNRAVELDSAAFEIWMPGAIAPPRNSPLSETMSYVVAVPKSITMTGPPYRWYAARAFTMRSAPTSRGLSVRIGIPVRVPGSTTTGGKLKYGGTISRSGGGGG